MDQPTTIPGDRTAAVCAYAAAASVERPAWLRTALMAAGAAAAGAAWLAWPYWYYRAGQYLGGRLRSGTVPAAGAQDGG